MWVYYILAKDKVVCKKQISKLTIMLFCLGKTTNLTTTLKKLFLWSLIQSGYPCFHCFIWQTYIVIIDWGCIILVVFSSNCFFQVKFSSRTHDLQEGSGLLTVCIHVDYTCTCLWISKVNHRASAKEVTCNK